ncbi:dermokine isoform 2-T2 [Hipposideros larvatus]
MKFQGSLACLLLALCLGSAEAGPLLSRGRSADAGVGEAVGHGVGEALGHGVGEALGHIIGEAGGQGVGDAGGSGIRDAVGPWAEDAFGHRVGEAVQEGSREAAHALGNTGSEAGRQAESIIRHGIDAAHGSWQGMPGSNGAWGTNGQPPSGGHGIPGSQGGLGAHSQGNPGGSGTPLDHVYSGGSGGSFGTNSQGSSWGQGGNGGPHNFGTNPQGAVAQPGYGSVRGNGNPNTECINSLPSGSDGSSSNSWGSSDSSGGSYGGSHGGGGSYGGSNGGGGSYGGSYGGSNGGGGSYGGSNGGGGSYGGSNGGGGSYGGSNGGGGSYGGSHGGGGSHGSSGGGSSGSSNSGGNWDSNTGSSSGGRGGSGYKPECDNSGNEVRMSGGSEGQGFRGGPEGPRGFGDIREISKEGSRFVGGSQGNYQGQWSSGEGEAVGGINNLNSETSPGLLNFENFWKNLKSKLGFINWDAINKGQIPAPSTRALLYFSRLWEDFKHNTPFLNWKAIIENPNESSLQKRAGSAGQPDAGWQEVAAVTSKSYNQQAYPTASGGQYSAKIPPKASRAQPGLLEWAKFW